MHFPGKQGQYYFHITSRSWRDSCARVTFSEPPLEASGERGREGKSFKLTSTHSSRGSAAKTVQLSHANPASCADYILTLT